MESAASSQNCQIDKFLRPERFCTDPASSSAKHEWIHWKRTFENFLLSNREVSDEIKLQLLHNHIGPTIFAYISDCSGFNDALHILDRIYVKPENEIYARHSLANRRQQVGESVDQYLQVLKQMAKNCGFKAVSAEQNKNDYIRDAFIAGLLSAPIRQRLLENTSLQLEEAFNQARSLEMAQLHSGSFASNNIINAASSGLSDITCIDGPTTVPDHVALSVKSGPDKRKCFFCGNEPHPRYLCPALNATCRNCGRKGHYAKVCKSKQNKTVTAATECLSCMAAASSCLQKALIPITINKVAAEALVDTGSTTSFISSALVEKCNAKRMACSDKITMASTIHVSRVEGSCVVTIDMKGHTYTDVTLLIMKDLCADIIIGHDLLKDHSSLEVAFGGPRMPLKICCISQSFIPPVSLFSDLRHDCKPIAIKSRKYSQEDEEFINFEIQKLLAEGVIEESRSPWRAQVLVTTNAHHKRRMVVDYSQTINRFTQLDAYPLPSIEGIISRVSQYSVFSSIDLQSAYHQIPILDKEKPYTAFEAGGNLYQFRRIPFGVTNGVASFQRVIDSLIKNEKLEGTFVYLDDITICGNDQEEHDKNLNRFLEIADKYNLTLNKSKCVFSQKMINILGYTVQDKTIRPDPERLKPLLELKPPINFASLKRTLGLFSHYAKWIPKYSEKAHPLIHCSSFPISSEAESAFQTLKSDIAKSVVTAIEDKTPFTVETDASDFAIAATLSQAGRPVAFYSRTLSDSERRHSSVEKEAYAIVESLRKWRHYLIGRSFRLITDQKSVSFMFDNKQAGKIKNDKIQRWRMELSNFKYDIIYRPGKDNTVADALSRTCATTITESKLFNLHQSLCHPGVTRMTHWIRSKNLPYSVDDVKRMIASCPICAVVKPRFHRNESHLIKATKPFERLSLDFKGPLPSSSRNRYLLTVIDEYSRFPFAFPCLDLSAGTVIKHLTNLFSVFGMPEYIHSDRGSSFMSKELKYFLHIKGIATSRTTPYNPQGNGQVERLNGTLWRTIELALRTKGLKVSEWEVVLQDALHAIRSLLCTAINATPHERMFHHNRKSTNGQSIPTWLSSPGVVLMKKPVRRNRYESLVEEVQLLEANPDYSHIQLPDGRETTVSNRYLAPSGERRVEDSLQEQSPEPEQHIPEIPEEFTGLETAQNSVSDNPQENTIPRHSSRQIRPPKYLEDYHCFMMGRM